MRRQVRVKGPVVILFISTMRYLNDDEFMKCAPFNHFIQVLGSCSHGHDTVPLCIISHQNKQIMESSEFKSIK